MNTELNINALNLDDFANKVNALDIPTKNQFLNKVGAMPATPSGDPMHYAYVTAGAEYNDTGVDIVKTAPWADMVDDDYVGDYGKTVVHKAGYWYLNGLGDLTNENMRIILLENSTIFTHEGNYDYYSSWAKGKTTLPLYSGNISWTGNLTLYSRQFAHYMGNCIVFHIISGTQKLRLMGTAKSGIFNESNSLMHCLDTIQIATIDNDCGLSRCRALVTIKIALLTLDISIKKSSKLSIKSVLYMINNEAATSEITITLHNTVYNRCMANADIAAALEAHPYVQLADAGATA